MPLSKGASRRKLSNQQHAEHSIAVSHKSVLTTLLCAWCLEAPDSGGKLPPDLFLGDGRFLNEWPLCSRKVSMKTYMRITLLLAVATLLLAGLGAGPQSTDAAIKGKNPGNASTTSSTSGQKASNIGGSSSGNNGAKQSPLHEGNGSGTNPLYESRDSIAKGNGSSVTPSQDDAKTKSGTMGNIKNNPLYKDKSEGTNPLYEGRDSVTKSNGNSGPEPKDGSAQTKMGPSTGNSRNPGVVEYKDGDDATTRYRPGNNKTATIKPSSRTGSSGVVEYKDGEDGTMHTRPSNPK
jgi:hypothetical protein